MEVDRSFLHNRFARFAALIALDIAHEVRAERYPDSQERSRPWLTGLN